MEHTTWEALQPRRRLSLGRQRQRCGGYLVRTQLGNLRQGRASGPLPDHELHKLPVPLDAVTGSKLPNRQDRIVPVWQTAVDPELATRDRNPDHRSPQRACAQFSWRLHVSLWLHWTRLAGVVIRRVAVGVHVVAVCRLAEVGRGALRGGFRVPGRWSGRRSIQNRTSRRANCPFCALPQHLQLPHGDLPRVLRSHLDAPCRGIEHTLAKGKKGGPLGGWFYCDLDTPCR